MLSSNSVASGRARRASSDSWSNSLHRSASSPGEKEKGNQLSSGRSGLKRAIYIQWLNISHVTHTQRSWLVGALIRTLIRIQHSIKIEDIFFSRVYSLNSLFPGTQPTLIRSNQVLIPTALDLCDHQKSSGYRADLRSEIQSGRSRPFPMDSGVGWWVQNTHATTHHVISQKNIRMLFHSQAAASWNHLTAWIFFYSWVRHFSVKAMNQDGSWFNKIKSYQIKYVWELWFLSTKNSPYW